MPWQLVYTSTPSGLSPGRSGFCVAARHRAISERLATALERISFYEPLRARPVIFSYRPLNLSGALHGVLTRYCDAGLDYTSRRNYLAHHLVFSAEEMAALPPPAEVARRWTDWLSAWRGPAQWLPDSGGAPPAGFLQQKPQTSLPAEFWKKLTGDAGNAALPCPDGSPVETLLDTSGALPADDTDSLLRLFAETSLLARAGAWSAGFTTHAQPLDISAQTPWRAVPDAESAASLPNARNLLALRALGAAPASLPAATLARAGLPPPRAPRPTLSTRRPDTAVRAAAKPAANTPPASSAAIKTPAVVAAEIPAPSFFAKLAEHPFLLLLALALTLALVPAFYFVKNTSAPARPAAQNTSAPNSPAPLSSAQRQAIHTSETLNRELDTALAKGRWRDAACAWNNLLAADPDRARQRKSQTLPLIQEKLASAILVRLEKQFRNLAPRFRHQALAALRETCDEDFALLASLKIRPTPDEQKRLALLNAQLTFLEKLPPAIPSPLFFSWPRHQRLQAPALHKFLGECTPPLTLSLFPANNWASLGDAKAVSISIPDKDFDKNKKILFVRLGAQNSPRIQFFRESPPQVKMEITPAPPADISPAERLLAASPRVQITFAGAKRKRTTLTLISPLAPPPPLSAPLSLLDTSAPTQVALPAWLVRALSRFAPPGTHFILIPLSEKDLAQHYPPKTNIAAGDVKKAMQREQAALKAKLAETQQRLDQLKTKRVTLSSGQKDADADIAREENLLKLTIQKQNELEKREQAFARAKTTPFVKQLGAKWLAACVDPRDNNLLPVVVFE